MVDASTQSEPLINALIDALIRERKVARSFGQAATRVSDPHVRVEHHHTPQRASGSGVLTVSKPSGPGMINTPTQREPLETKAPPPSIGTYDPEEGALLRLIRTGAYHPIKRTHTPKRASKSGKAPKATAPS
eukprot:5695997-Pleurochrysis_carterae.AAC.1